MEAALDNRIFTADWASAKWIWWLGLYLILGIFVPWTMTRTWAHQHGSKIRPTLRQLFQRGELGLAALVLAISVMWDLQNSQYAPQTLAVGSVILALSGIMAGAVWIEGHCRHSAGVEIDPKRVWRDSRNLAFLILSIAGVAEILLDRFTKAMRP